MLPIFEITGEITPTKTMFPFQFEGNYNNWKWGLIEAFQDLLLTFHFKKKSGGTLTTFEARKIKVYGKEVHILETIDLIGYKPNEYNNTNYELELQLLDDILEEGLYYFYMSDGNFQHVSDIFCVKEGMIYSIQGLVFNIFNTTGISGAVIFDDSDNLLNFTYTKGRELYSNGDVVMTFAKHFYLSDFTISNTGTASIKVNKETNQIYFGVGTIYGLTLTNSTRIYNFPLCENYNYVYDINYNERAGVRGGFWTDLQETIFVQNGMTKITTDEYSDTIYIPYNQFGVPNYNENSLNSNEYKSGVTYPINYIFYNDGEYYKVTTSFTSTYFDNDTSNFTII
jgi:hypothetical protein